MPGGETWQEYQRLVLHQLEVHSERLEAISTDVHSLRTEIALLKLKMAFIGAISGAVVGILVQLANRIFP